MEKDVIIRITHKLMNVPPGPRKRAQYPAGSGTDLNALWLKFRFSSRQIITLPLLSSVGKLLYIPKVYLHI